jgi:lipoprotein-anchoring transpeptidase ErfK/SrfK
MLLRLVIVLVTTLGFTLVTAPASLAQDAAPNAAPVSPLEARFAAAERDPAQVVPLIFEVSAHIPTVDAAAGHALADRLEPFARRAFFSPEALPGQERLGFIQHKVASGELPGAIAKRHRFGAGLFKYWNAGFDERRIGAGKELKLLDLSQRTLQVIVDKQRFRVSVWLQVPSGEWLLAMYVPVGVGAAESPTPSGVTSVTSRVREPQWTHPKTREVFPHGHPENVLGGYWIALDSAPLGGRTGIGLHGYTGAPAPDWIERGASNGCIRMLQPDIDRLFELALEGVKVTLAP